MTDEDRQKIISDDYAEVIIEYAISPDELSAFQGDTFNYIDSKYAVIYFPVTEISEKIIGPSKYSMIPKIYGLLETPSLEEMGVDRLQRIPALSLNGQGVLLGFVDTGIDYTSPLFQNADNTTRIVSIWDQTIVNTQSSVDTFYYGTEYNREQINLALKNDNPLSIVPCVDDIGHGTTLAGLAGGTRIEESNFVGVAPLSEFIIVKLKTAKSRLKEYFCAPDGVICYAESDIMFAIRYLVNVAKKNNRPVAICFGLGTNQGGHEGLDALSDLLETLANEAGTGIIIAAGNEGNSGHHYYGEIDNNIGYNAVELNIGENEHNFSMELWGNTPGTYTIDVLSPSGEYIARIPARLGSNKRITFLFEPTVILIDYILVESQSGDQVILLQFQNPVAGVWKFRVYSGTVSSGFHIWLPMRGFITENTKFLNPDPHTTITNPGNNVTAITVTAYNHQTQSIYLNASRGFTRINIVKPDVAAPGVDVYSPLPNMNFGELSGTSIAAALATGIVALLLEWGVVRGNDSSMDSAQIKKHLIRGANRYPTVIYPNKELGYGTLSIYEVFESLKKD